MKVNHLFFLCFITCLFSCKNTAKQTSVETQTEDSVEVRITEKQLPELVAEELFLKGKEPFGEIIELKGKQIIADTVIFKIMGAEGIIKDNKLFLKTSRNLLLFRLPDMVFEGFYGTWGNGPDEFNYPHIVPTPNDNSLLCYIFESTKEKMYKVSNDGNITPYAFNINKSQNTMFSSKFIINIAPDDFIYADNSPTGKSIFRAQKVVDSLNNREVFNLALNPKRKSPFSYIGDFAANPAKNRMVYAYKYFKMLKFMDLEAQTVKTINFEREEFNESTLYKVDGLDQNVTHYWGACAQEEHVYFLYSGRTPYDVVKECSKQNYYIYVEQYDWNGNPVNKFKLDKWGYFTVDEANKKIYLMSTYHDDPFFIYDLP